MKYAALVKAIHSASVHSQGRAALAVNQALVLRNWLVGAWIFEFEQSGKDRAKYGERLLETLAADLQKKEVTGLNVRALDRSRLLYQTYPILASAIPATLSSESAEINSPSTHRSSPQIRQTLSAESPSPLSPEALLRLSWSHLQELIATIPFHCSVAVSASHESATVTDRRYTAKDILVHDSKSSPLNSSSASLGVLCAFAVKNTLQSPSAASPARSSARLADSGKFPRRGNSGG